MISSLEKNRTHGQVVRASHIDSGQGFALSQTNAAGRELQRRE